MAETSQSTTGKKPDKPKRTRKVPKRYYAVASVDQERIKFVVLRNGKSEALNRFPTMRDAEKWLEEFADPGSYAIIRVMETYESETKQVTQRSLKKGVRPKQEESKAAG